MIRYQIMNGRAWYSQENLSMIHWDQFRMQIVHKLIAIFRISAHNNIFIYKNLTLTLSRQENWLEYCVLKFPSGNQFMYDLPLLNLGTQ